MPDPYYITTAIAYVNGKPHAGHMLEFIQADFLARYQRAIGKDTRFLTGTDEHGQKIVEAAKAQNKDTKTLVDENTQVFKDFTQFLNMSNDDFIRTTDQDKHWPSVIELWKRMAAKGDIYKKAYEGLYCVGCEKFVTEKELDDDGNCPNHQTKPKLIQEENYFFKLSAYAEAVKKLITTDQLVIVPETRRNEVLSFLDSDVQDISFSRHKDNLSWGIPVPGDDEQVMYVWCDALTNYISALDLAGNGDLYQKYWPADVHIIGKDIIRFHAVYWPAMLLSAGEQPPKRILAHGFLNAGGQKMSKSLGNIIDPYAQIEKYGLEAVRLFLLKDISTHDDGDYAEEAVVDMINNELANELGNLVRRVTVLIDKNFGGTIPKQGDLEEVDKKLIESADFFTEFDEYMTEFDFSKALKRVWTFVKRTNKYLTETEPWKETDKDRLSTILYNALESTRVIAHYLAPAMPSTAAEILKQIGQEDTGLSAIEFKPDTSGSVEKGDILFKKLETPEAGEQQFLLNVKVAEIESADNHPEADKLLVLQLNLGEEKRQLVAGIKGHYELDELPGKKIVMISNLKYAKLRGVESQGMLLAAENKEGLELISPDAAVGTAVTCGDMENNTEQITIDDFAKLKIKVVDGKVFCDGRALHIDGKQLTTSKVLDGKVR